MSERDGLVIEYRCLDGLQHWEDNAKLHDLMGIITSIERYGFKVPLRYEPALNSGRGGVACGNGRLAALRYMKARGYPRPEGIRDGGGGTWLVPVVRGNDSPDEVRAASYGLTANLSTIPHGSMSTIDRLGMFDSFAFEKQLAALKAADALPVGLHEEELEFVRSGRLLAAADQDAAQEITREAKKDDGLVTIRVQVSPSVKALYDELLELSGAETEPEGMRRILECVNE